MDAYVKVVGLLLKFANYVAAALQQHHDELNGANKQVVATDEATTKVLESVAAPTSIAERDKLWDANEAKFGSGIGPSGN